MGEWSWAWLAKLMVGAGALAAATGRAAGQEAGAPGRWSEAKAWAWHERQPWLVGCNYVPSTAVNDVEMWQRETFDPETIERELAWAQDLGLNSARVFANYVVWKADPGGFRKRFGEFLAIADRHGITVMPVLFDDCAFAGKEPRVGQQDDPVPGVHNSGWVPSPGLKLVADRSAWPDLERYVRDVVGTFGQDQRVVVWDLYNEPGNSGMGERSLPLMEAAFAWARAAKPSQPLTVGAWANFRAPMQRRMIELSDVVSLHGYDALPGMRAKLALCATHGRPILCTEWLRRQVGNGFRALLPLFRQHQVGCYHWGLVAGRTQTYMPWGSPRGASVPALWQHDLLHGDGRPFSAVEARFLKSVTGRVPPPRAVVLAATAEQGAVAWRYALERPAAEWPKPGFDDSAWRQGAAPFGREEPPIGRHPRTPWTDGDIWLRRRFELPDGPLGELALRIHHDEDAEVYLNGVLAARVSGYNASYDEFDIAAAARAALKAGRNLLAVHCHQRVGGQFIDVGLVGYREPAANGGRR